VVKSRITKSHNGRNTTILFIYLHFEIRTFMQFRKGKAESIELKYFIIIALHSEMMT